MEPGRLDKQKHLKYWLRCLKVYLPPAYSSMDSNRMMLAYFTLSALDLLGSLFSSTTEAERESYKAWIYHCQHPDGGFRGGLVSNLDTKYSVLNKAWDPASVPATYFAIASLLILRDDLSRVKKTDCLRWLKTVQRPDGSFGQTMGEGGSFEGGFDTRFGYTAIGVKWMLEGGKLPSRTVELANENTEIDFEALAKSIARLQAYGGGITDLEFHEDHGGYTFCALAALSLMERPISILNDRLLLRWLIYRATIKFDLDEEDDFDTHDAAVTEQLKPKGVSESESGLESQNSDYLGFAGRPNKTADTCYAWWIGASLQILGKLDLLNKEKAREYLLKLTQHRIGGFAKYPEDPPDLYHSYFGLAALALLGNEDIKPIHPAACISIDTVQYLQRIAANSQNSVSNPGKQLC